MGFNGLSLQIFYLVWFGSTKVIVWTGLASINERVDRSGLINEHMHVWFGAGLVRMHAHCQICMQVFKPPRKADSSGNEFTSSLVSLRMHA